METYIEVSGEAEYEELPSKILVDLDITVRAAKSESAEKELKEIINKTLDTLFANDLSEDEVKFGGRETYTPWWKRKKSGVESRSRVTVTGEDRTRIYKALDAIDKHTKHKRIDVNISERQPMFKPDEAQFQSALTAAMGNAREKAEVLAKAAGAKVGDVLQIQETQRSVRSSGSYGDHAWGDAVFAAGSVDFDSGDDALEIEPTERIKDNSRTITIKYKVKFRLN